MVVINSAFSRMPADIQAKAFQSARACEQLLLVEAAKAAAQSLPHQAHPAGQQRQTDHPGQEVRADAAVAGVAGNLRRAGDDDATQRQRAGADGDLLDLHPIIPALTMMARRLANSSSTNLPKPGATVSSVSFDEEGAAIGVVAVVVRAEDAMGGLAEGQRSRLLNASSAGTR